jgi:hypothetical protein
LTEKEQRHEHRSKIGEQWQSLEGVVGYLGRACGIPRGAFDPRGRNQAYPLVTISEQMERMKHG